MKTCTCKTKRTSDQYLVEICTKALDLSTSDGENITLINNTPRTLYLCLRGTISPVRTHTLYPSGQITITVEGLEQHDIIDFNPGLGIAHATRPGAGFAEIIRGQWQKLKALNELMYHRCPECDPVGGEVFVYTSKMVGSKRVRVFDLRAGYGPVSPSPIDIWADPPQCYILPGTEL